MIKLIGEYIKIFILSIQTHVHLEETDFIMKNKNYLNLLVIGILKWQFVPIFLIKITTFY